MAMTMEMEIWPSDGIGLHTAFIPFLLALKINKE